MWSPYANSESDTVRKFKTLMCYNQYYQGEHCIHYMRLYNDSDNSWNMSSRVVVYDGDSLAYLLSGWRAQAHISNTRQWVFQCWLFIVEQLPGIKKSKLAR